MKTRKTSGRNTNRGWGTVDGINCAGLAEILCVKYNEKKLKIYAWRKIDAFTSGL